MRLLDRLNYSAARQRRRSHPPVADEHRENGPSLSSRSSCLLPVCFIAHPPQWSGPKCKWITPFGFRRARPPDSPPMGEMVREVRLLPLVSGPFLSHHIATKVRLLSWPMIG